MDQPDMTFWSPAELYRQLVLGSRFSILDVRNPDEFDAWRIEGKTPVPAINMPYFELLDLEGDDEDLGAAVARAVPIRLKDSLPRDRPILAVCAKGDTSIHVADGLRRLGYLAYNLSGGMAAWGDHYEMHVVEDTARLTLLQISRPARGCLSYLLASGHEAMVVDPSRHIDVYTRIAAERGWRITSVLETHLQADHISGGRALAKSLGVDYWWHPLESINPEDPLPAAFDFRRLDDGMVFTLGQVDVRILHLPGHTLGMCNPLLDGRFLLTGDTLFINSIGRPDLGGQAKDWAGLLYRSLQRLMAMADATIVLPAHSSDLSEADEHGVYRASVGYLRNHNEGLLMLTKGLDVFSAYILGSLPTHPPAYDEIRRLNIGLDQADEAKASELELGRNLCALSHGEAGQRRVA